MTGFTRRALREFDALTTDYRRVGRDEALNNLERAIQDATARSIAEPDVGSWAPAAYPAVMRKGTLKTKSGAYWFRYRIRSTLALTGVFYDRANIPGRL